MIRFRHTEFARYLRWFSRRAFAAFLFLAVVGAAWFVYAIRQPLDPAPYLGVDASAEVLDRDGEPLQRFLNPEEQWCFPRPLDSISPHLVRATLAAEDQRFYDHAGVDPLAIVRAAWGHVTGEDAGGASTITMQLIKRDGTDSRSIVGKFRQAVRALRLERAAPKEEMLEAYLNTAPYGMNLLGCEAAARRYFGKGTHDLTLAEAATLSGLPKSPTAYMPLRHPGRAQARRDAVLGRMVAERMITQAERDEATTSPLTVARQPFPMDAPHLAMRMRGAASETIQLTLDAGIQRTAQFLVNERVTQFKRDVRNGAAIVIEVDSGDVLAYVGSADFFGSEIGGQVDLCRAPRSPGSTLKPFIYGLAMEQSRLFASEALFDAPWNNGLYNPENFDLSFHGLVSAKDALRFSLNIPALNVLERIGVAELQHFLMSAGMTTLRRSPDEYGLGITLGSCEVSLVELAQAYSMIARLGEFKPLRFNADALESAPVRLLSRGVCLKLYDMLQLPLPGDMDRRLVQSFAESDPICWKTGTSPGNRDAWAVVFNRRYVVAVWMGNNDAQPADGLVGARAALPLAGKIMRALPSGLSVSWPSVGDELRPVAVCAKSGLPVGQWCPVSRDELLPRAQFVDRVCRVHYAAPGTTDILERWPATAHGWDLARIRVPAPAQSPKVQAARSEPLRILVPSEAAEYVLTREPNGDRLRLTASGNARSLLHWYSDGRYLGVTEGDRELLYTLAPGSHTVTAMTAEGATASVDFDVADAPADAARGL